MSGHPVSKSSVVWLVSGCAIQPYWWRYTLKLFSIYLLLANIILWQDMLSICMGNPGIFRAIQCKSTEPHACGVASSGHLMNYTLTYFNKGLTFEAWVSPMVWTVSRLCRTKQADPQHWPLELCFDFWPLTPRTAAPARTVLSLKLVL